MDLLDRFVAEDLAVDTPTYDEISRAISNGDAATDMGAAWDVGLIKGAGGGAQGATRGVRPLPAGGARLRRGARAPEGVRRGPSGSARAPAARRRRASGT